MANEPTSKPAKIYVVVDRAAAADAEPAPMVDGGCVTTVCVCRGQPIVNKGGMTFNLAKLSAFRELAAVSSDPRFGGGFP